MQGEQQLCEIFGNYMGFIEFNGERYWDVRDQVNFSVQPIPEEETVTDLPGSLPLRIASDCSLRADSLALIGGDVVQAQTNKNAMEEQQRSDRKLREAAAKRRSKGGPKIDYSVYTKAVKK